MMLKIVGLFVLALSAQALAKTRLTPLAIDNYPCKAENLKGQKRYICTTQGEVKCNNGWSKDNDTNPMQPCSTPICEAGCVHGKCKNPDTCACQVGWEGNDCNTCVTLPGCVHGSCNGTALACKCTDDNQWTGGLCDVPVCSAGCVNGHCIAPGQCKCNPGWTGTNCTECVPLKGCSAIGGSCVDPSNPSRQVPNGCLCKPGYTGPTCSQPKCDDLCNLDHAVCEFSNKTAMTGPICKCKLGWQGTYCDQCLEYPGCPLNATTGGCINPYECNCNPGDTNPVCDIHNL